MSGVLSTFASPIFKNMNPGLTRVPLLTSTFLTSKASTNRLQDRLGGKAFDKKVKSEKLRLAQELLSNPQKVATPDVLKLAREGIDIATKDPDYLGTDIGKSIQKALSGLSQQQQTAAPAAPAPAPVAPVPAAAAPVAAPLGTLGTNAPAPAPAAAAPRPAAPAPAPAPVPAVPAVPQSPAAPAAVAPPPAQVGQLGLGAGPNQAVAPVAPGNAPLAEMAGNAGNIVGTQQQGTLGTEVDARGGGPRRGRRGRINTLLSNFGDATEQFGG